MYTGKSSLDSQIVPIPRKLPPPEEITHEEITFSIPRLIRTEDLEQVADLYSEWQIGDPCSHCACLGGVQYLRDAAWLKEHVAIPGARLLIAQQGKDIIGFAQFFTDSRYFPDFAGDLAERYLSYGRLAYIYLILVKRNCQRKGLGRELYERVFKEAHKSGCETLLAEIFVCPVPNSASLRFHESLGFEYSGQSVSHQRSAGERQITLTYAQLFKRLT